MVQTVEDFLHIIVQEGRRRVVDDGGYYHILHNSRWVLKMGKNQPF
jgi:hypothetical protein